MTLRSKPVTRRSGNASSSRQAFTLPEVLITLVVSGLLMAAVLMQMIESLSLGLRTARTVEHSQSTRSFIFQLSEDTRNAQLLTIYPSFSDRSDEMRDGETGDFLVLQEMDASGVITRSVGYYIIAAPSGAGWLLYRFDSSEGGISADTLPDASTSGTHRLITRAVTLPDSNHLFRCVRDRAVTIRGEFGTVDGAALGPSEFLQCTLATRS